MIDTRVTTEGRSSLDLPAIRYELPGAGKPRKRRDLTGPPEHHPLVRAIRQEWKSKRRQRNRVKKKIRLFLQSVWGWIVLAAKAVVQLPPHYLGLVLGLIGALAFTMAYSFWVGILDGYDQRVRRREE